MVGLENKAVPADILVVGNSLFSPGWVGSAGIGYQTGRFLQLALHVPAPHAGKGPLVVELYTGDV
jgi:hypothetical protein